MFYTKMHSISICDHSSLSFFRRDGRAQVSRKVIHSSEPIAGRKAPDKYRSNWYSRVNQRLQEIEDNRNNFSSLKQDRERNPNRHPPFLGSATTSSNSSEAVVKFGF